MFDLVRLIRFWKFVVESAAIDGSVEFVEYCIRFEPILSLSNANDRLLVCSCLLVGWFVVLS